MYRSPSPFAQEQQYHPQPFSTPTGQITPGAVTYTTSMGPDGRTLYHPFKAVAASYQTPTSIVSGIQWVPAEATLIAPVGAQPANSEFAASWNRGFISKEDQKALKSWQRDEDKRRKKEEKDSKRLRDQDRMGQAPYNDPEYELRRARERDAQSNIGRERRKSFNAGVPGAPPGSVGFPSSGGNAGYVGSTGYPSSPYQAYTEPSITNTPYVTPHASGYGHNRNTSGNVNDLSRQFNDVGLRDGEYTTERERKNSRPRKYSTGERSRAISGNYGERPTATGIYGNSGPYVQATSPYTSTKPYPTQQGSVGHYPVNASYSGASPNMRASELSGGPVYPGSAYASSARSATDPISRSTTPFGAGPAGVTGVFPRGHVMEGQPMMPKSRATTPIPGSPNHMGNSYNQGGVVNFPQATIPNLNASPRIGGASPHIAAGNFSGEQLAAPEGFSRPINGAQPFTHFNKMKIQDMEEFLQNIPRMPLVLQPHDVFHEDWIRLMQDLSLAWVGKLPVPDLNRNGRPPKRATLAADLIDVWNRSFFLARGIEVILYKGRERRSGLASGVVDLELPHTDDPDSLSSSSSSLTEDDSEDDYSSRVAGPYGRPTGQGSMADIAEGRRRRREAREEKRRRRKERRNRRKEREREKKYALYIACVTPGSSGGAALNSAMPGGYPAMQGGYGGGY